MAPKGKKPAPMPGAAAKKAVEKKATTNPLFEKKPKTFGVGQSLPAPRDVGRFVRWPRYIRIQRQRRILYKRLKVPPAIAQFTRALDKSTATSLFKLLAKYRPEDKQAKKDRLMDEAEKRAAEESETKSQKPLTVKYGLNHITYLIEQGKASLVIIAHDVDPIELVVWLPALCRKMKVPYCIVKGKARLGQVVHKKTATALALTSVKNEDKPELAKLIDTINSSFLEQTDFARKQWGGGIMGVKSQAKTRAKEKVMAKEAAKRSAVA